MELSIDIEVTNRCNAKCHFCPRDQTPHQGLMTQEVFDQALLRSIEFREALRGREPKDPEIHLCGLGEPLLNRRAAAYARQATDEGFFCSMATNGSLLTEERGQELLDAGVRRLSINVGEKDEAYEEVYKLPWERTRDNVARFIEMADGQCEVSIVLVDHRGDSKHLQEMVQFWKGYGAKKFSPFNVINRGGALFVDHMQFESYPELSQARSTLSERSGKEPICFVPFLFLFVGYDGQYYLCCSDWKKEAPLGSVFDTSFLAITDKKLDAVLTRDPVCKTCNCDPVNRLTESIRAVNSGQESEANQEKLAQELVTSTELTWGLAERYGEIASEVGAEMDPIGDESRRLIPLSVD